MATMELARVDASCATFYLVHTFLAMLTISLMVGAGGAGGGVWLQSQSQLQTVVRQTRLPPLRSQTRLKGLEQAGQTVSQCERGEDTAFECVGREWGSRGETCVSCVDDGVGC